MRHLFHSWKRHAEDPVGATIRSDITAERVVADAAYNYQRALSQGNKVEIASARANLRQAWETSVRRKGGHPEDFIPNYPHYDPLPIQHSFLFGDAKEEGLINPRSISLGIIVYTIWMAFK